MSDTRKQIAERLLNEHRYFSSVDTLLVGTRDVEKCMSEYAAALLEPPLTTEERQSLYTLMSQWARNTDLQFEEVVKWINNRARARAAQERER